MPELARNEPLRWLLLNPLIAKFFTFIVWFSALKNLVVCMHFSQAISPQNSQYNYYLTLGISFSQQLHFFGPLEFGSTGPTRVNIGSAVEKSLVLVPTLNSYFSFLKSPAIINPPSSSIWGRNPFENEEMEEAAIEIFCSFAALLNLPCELIFPSSSNISSVPFLDRLKLP